MRRVLSIFRRFILVIKYAVTLIFGLIYYLFSGKSLPSSYQAMIFFFCLTRGKFNDYLSYIVSRFKAYDPSLIPTKESIFSWDIDKEDQILQSLETKGYYVMNSSLSAELCDRIEAYALETPVYERGGSRRKIDVFPRNHPAVCRYDFKPDQILSNPLFNSLIVDPLLVKVAARYLKAPPILDVLGLWWHTAFGEGPDAESAQFFHFDMDRIKWLKIFVYITDVDEKAGPHCFIAGSHRTNGIPSTLLRHGYARLTDEQVEKEYGQDEYRSRYIEFMGKRGTVILEDTRGLHKGKHVESGDRLMFQAQFSNALFGGYYPESSIPRSNRVLAETIRKMGIPSFYGTEI